MSRRPAAGLDRLRQRAEDALSRGEYYEALQLFKTVAARHETREAARKTLLDGAQAMAAAGQSVPAAELCELAETTTGDGWAADSGERVVQVALAIPDLAARRRVLARVISAADPNPARDSAHLALADVAGQLGDLALAHRSLLAGRAPPSRVAQLVARAGEDGEPAEWDMFVARSVLLCAHDGRTPDLPHDVLAELVRHRACDNAPLVRFVQFVLALARLPDPRSAQAVAAFRDLRRRYNPALTLRDPALAKLADRVGEKLFGATHEAAAAAATPQAANFADLLSTMFGGMTQQHP
jgi:hypothetical protein